jgi:uncharacterized protein (DUF736 family)
MEKTPICIWKNKYKKAENQPDYRITLKIGDKYKDFGALWAKKAKNGETFLGGILEEKKPYKKEETNQDVDEIDISKIDF